MEKLILGVGTGRCGMYSMSHLLSMQNGSNITWHFGNMPIINWYYNDSDFDRICYMLDNREGEYIGDVSHFLLNYISPLLDRYGDKVRIVHLLRNYNEICMSFKNFIYKMSENVSLNLWNSLDFSNTFYNLLSMPNALYFWNLYHTFPNFDETDDMNESIRYYYDYYERAMNKLQEVCSEQIYSFYYTSLNDVQECKQLLTWIGWEFPLYSNIRKENPNVVGGRVWV